MGADQSSSTGSNEQEQISVMLEPLAGIQDEEMLTWLQDHTVGDATLLAPRFISATLPASLLEAAKQMANVSIKVRKQRR